MRLALGLAWIGLVGLAACPPPATYTGGGGGAHASGGAIDPEACGTLSTSDAGRKVHAFLLASAELERASLDVDASVAGACKRMAAELGTSPEGTTKEVCDRVATELDANLKVSVSTEHRLVTRYAPPVCHTDASIAGGFVAECEAAGTATGTLRCHGTCDGTCSGPCDGTCASGDNASCRGACTGECKGSCGGRCDGFVEVDASAECKASAEVRASVRTECTEPHVEVVRQDVTVVDATRFQHAVAAIELGLPKLLVAGKRFALASEALAHWANEGGELVASASGLVMQLGTQAACVGAQLAGAVSASATIQARFEVSIEASAHVSASAGAP